METFLDLLLEHEELNELFLQHQEALMALDVARARSLLRAYEQRLYAHMEAEEMLLLPVYKRAGSIPGGPPIFYTGEHKRMRELLARFHAHMDEMEALDRKSRKAIALFDSQATYKHLVEHHDLREKNILYPTLDRVTTPDERQDLLRRFSGSAPQAR